MLPKRRKTPRRTEKGRCPSHLQWIRGCVCSVWGCKNTQIEAAHVRIGTDGGIGLKPSDKWTIPLCSDHHREQHQIGEKAFEKKYKINMKGIAEQLANASPHRDKLKEVA